MDKIASFFSSYKRIIAVVTGCILSVFSLGLFNIPIFVFIWPFLYLYYIHHSETKKKPILIVCGCSLFANLIKWIGYSNTNIGVDFLMGLYLSINTMLPFVIDGIFYKKIERWRSVLLFPLVVSSLDYIFAFVPISGINSYAYAQVENLVLSQILSLFGIYFLSFIIALFASLLDYAIDYFNENRKITKLVYYYVLVIIIVYLYGGIYLHIGHSKDKVKIVSCLGISPIDYNSGNEHARPNAEYAEYVRNNTIKAKEIDAKLIMFAEESFYLHKNDYEDMISRTIEIAKEFNIYISIGLDVFTDDDMINYNDNILISNTGKRLYDYRKHFPIPIAEIEYKKGTGKLKSINTDFGKITTVICYDLNFPYFMNWIAFRFHPDIILAPSWDYPAVDRFQALNTAFKCIENGFNIIKNTAAGITAAIDYQGKFMTYYRADELSDYFVVSDVYIHGRKTLYSYIGFIFNILYIVGVFLVLFLKSDLLKKNNSDQVKEVINPE